MCNKNVENKKILTVEWYQTRTKIFDYRLQMKIQTIQTEINLLKKLFYNETICNYYFYVITTKAYIDIPKYNYIIPKRKEHLFEKIFIEI